MRQEEKLRLWALKYLELGWNVLPASGKHPVMRWQPYQSVRVTPGDWDRWVEEDKLAFDQIALVTGRISGATVLDIDVAKEGKEYAEPGWVAKQFDEEGNAPVSITGGGGHHVFFSFEDIPNSVKIAHPQLDTRSEGGIIILPPSAHESGNCYAWEDPTWMESHGALPTFPHRLKLALKQRPKRDWDGILRDGVHDGKRTATLTAVIGYALRMAPGVPEFALDVARTWNRKCTPPLPEAEVERTWQSITRKHGEDPENSVRPLSEMNEG